jgi:hypothetical protein
MTEIEINQLKTISIRGRFAYGLMCLEYLVDKLNPDLTELELLIRRMWKMTNIDKLGWWQNEFVENNPIVMLADYELMKSGKITFAQIGLETIKSEKEFENRISFMKLLKEPIPQVIDKLTQIANQNISAGCGKYSELTLDPTIELINIIENSRIIKTPEIEKVKFSKFTENNGWGNKFSRDMVFQH